MWKDKGLIVDILHVGLLALCLPILLFTFFRAVGKTELEKTIQSHKPFVIDEKVYICQELVVEEEM